MNWFEITSDNGNMLIDLDKALFVKIHDTEENTITINISGESFGFNFPIKEHQISCYEKIKKQLLS